MKAKSTKPHSIDEAERGPGSPGVGCKVLQLVLIHTAYFKLIHTAYFTLALFKGCNR